MALVQMAFIFMNVVAAFSSNARTARVRATRCNACNVVQCAIVSSPERRSGLLNQPARFAWYELLTTDVAAASDFYGKVVGWGATDGSTPELAYTVLTAGEVPVGGLMELPEEGRRQGATPRWVGYVAVDDGLSAPEEDRR